MDIRDRAWRLAISKTGLRDTGVVSQRHVFVLPNELRSVYQEIRIRFLAIPVVHLALFSHVLNHKVLLLYSSVKHRKWCSHISN